MNETDYIIVGQGICGTLLSWLLIREGKKVMVIDEYRQYSSGMVASGLINPVTGMRVAKSWMIDEMLPYADALYPEIEKDLGIDFYTKYDLLEFHPTIQVRDTYTEKILQHADYLHQYAYDDNWMQTCNFHYGISAISGCRVVDMRKLQLAWRERLKAAGNLLEGKFDITQCNVATDKITYKDIEAKKIIFCDGSAALHNPYFSLLPFALNKGEVLIARIPGLPRTHILKFGLKIVPWEDDLFWIGSSFDWKYNDLNPSEPFRARTEAQLKQWLKIPYTTEHHWASERPTTVDHKPFAGFHPSHPAVGMLNGMGAKGCSQAPYFANSIAQHLINGTPLNAEADIKRYTRILSRTV